MCIGNGLWKNVGYVGTLGNRDSQLASRRVLSDFTDGALTTSVGSLFKNGITRMLKAHGRRRVAEHIGVTA